MLPTFLLTIITPTVWLAKFVLIFSHQFNKLIKLSHCFACTFWKAKKWNIFLAIIFLSPLAAVSHNIFVNYCIATDFGRIYKLPASDILSAPKGKWTSENLKVSLSSVLRIKSFYLFRILTYQKHFRQKRKFKKCHCLICFRPLQISVKLYAPPPQPPSKLVSKIRGQFFF